jgi:hypothetical protein
MIELATGAQKGLTIWTLAKISSDVIKKLVENNTR